MGGAALLTAYIGWTAYRSLRFSQKFAPLLDRAQRFPTGYTVGRGEAVTYVSLGDSTAVGLGADQVGGSLTYKIAEHIASSGLTVVVHNLAASGARVQDVAAAQLPRLPPGRIAWVSLSVSANDATHGTDPGRFELSLDGLLRALSARGVGTVGLSTTPHFQHTPAVPFPLRSMWRRRARELSDVTRRVANRYSFVRIADLYGQGTLDADRYADDGFHPNGAGYRQWADVFASAMNVHKARRQSPRRDDVH